MNRLGRDDGVTLIELLISITLLAILLAMVVTAFTQFTRTFGSSRSATDSANVADIGMNEVTRVIRSGTEIEVKDADNLPVFITAKKEEILLYAYLDTDSLNPAPTLIQFKIDPVTRELVEKRWASAKVNGYWTFPAIAGTAPNRTVTASAIPTLTRVVARKLITPSTGAAFMFTYLKTAGCASAQPTCDIVPSGGNGLTADEIDDVVAVSVTMKVQSDPQQRAAPVTITNRVGIPNLGISRVGL